MFLTITIDTAQQKKSKFRMVRKSAHVTKGWRAVSGIKRLSSGANKTSFWQRISVLKKRIGGGIYKLGDQIAMF